MTASPNTLLSARTLDKPFDGNKKMHRSSSSLSEAELKIENPRRAERRVSGLSLRCSQLNGHCATIIPNQRCTTASVHIGSDSRNLTWAVDVHNCSCLWEERRISGHETWVHLYFTSGICFRYVPARKTSSSSALKLQISLRNGSRIETRVRCVLTMILWSKPC